MSLQDKEILRIHPMLEVGIFTPLAAAAPACYDSLLFLFLFCFSFVTPFTVCHRYVIPQMRVFWERSEPVSSWLGGGWFSVPAVTRAAAAALTRPARAYNGRVPR